MFLERNWMFYNLNIPSFELTQRTLYDSDLYAFKTNCWGDMHVVPHEKLFLLGQKYSNLIEQALNDGGVKKNSLLGYEIIETYSQMKSLLEFLSTSSEMDESSKYFVNKLLQGGLQKATVLMNRAVTTKE